MEKTSTPYVEKTRAFNLIIIDEAGAMVSIPSNRVTAKRIDRLSPDEVFVFGSNIHGLHDGGAARAAVHRFGAEYGISEGWCGQSYAIPTTGCRPQVTIQAIRRFIDMAKRHPHTRFLVTPIGCGHGDWDARLMARLFEEARIVPNISLPEVFWRYIV